MREPDRHWARRRGHARSDHRGHERTLSVRGSRRRRVLTRDRGLREIDADPERPGRPHPSFRQLPTYGDDGRDCDRKEERRNLAIPKNVAQRSLIRSREVHLHRSRCVHHDVLAKDGHSRIEVQGHGARPKPRRSTFQIDRTGEQPTHCERAAVNSREIPLEPSAPWSKLQVPWHRGASIHYRTVILRTGEIQVSAPPDISPATASMTSPGGREYVPRLSSGLVGKGRNGMIPTGAWS